MIIFRSSAIIADATIIDGIMEEEKSQRPDLAKVLGSGSFVRDYLGLSERDYSRYVTDSTMMNVKKRTCFMGQDHARYWLSTKNGLEISREGRKTFEPVEISRERGCEALSGRTVKPSMLDLAVFQRLCKELLKAERDGYDYLEAVGRPTWFDLISVEDEVVASVIDEIKYILFSPVEEFVQGLGMTKTAFANELMVSLRTVENWCDRKTGLKPSTRVLIAQHFWCYGIPFEKGDPYVLIA